MKFILALKDMKFKMSVIPSNLFDFCVGGHWPCSDKGCLRLVVTRA